MQKNVKIENIRQQIICLKELLLIVLWFVNRILYIHGQHNSLTEIVVILEK